MSGNRRVLWVDAGAGAAGDMILGALVDLGVPLTRLREALRGLPLPGWTLSSARTSPDCRRRRCPRGSRSWSWRRR